MTAKPVPPPSHLMKVNNSLPAMGTSWTPPPIEPPAPPCFTAPIGRQAVTCGKRKLYYLDGEANGRFPARWGMSWVVNTSQRRSDQRRWSHRPPSSALTAPRLIKLIKRVAESLGESPASLDEPRCSDSPAACTTSRCERRRVLTQRRKTLLISATDWKRLGESE